MIALLNPEDFVLPICDWLIESPGVYVIIERNFLCKN